MSDFSIRRRGDAVIVEVDDISSRYWSQLKQAILHELATGARRCIIDLQELEYLDSTGLGLLVGLRRTMRKQNGDLLVANLSERVKRIWAITGLERVLPIDDGTGDDAGPGCPAPVRPGPGSSGPPQAHRLPLTDEAGHAPQTQ